MRHAQPGKAGKHVAVVSTRAMEATSAKLSVWWRVGGGADRGWMDGKSGALPPLNVRTGQQPGPSGGTVGTPLL